MKSNSIFSLFNIFPVISKKQHFESEVVEKNMKVFILHQHKLHREQSRRAPFINGWKDCSLIFDHVFINKWNKHNKKSIYWQFSMFHTGFLALFSACFWLAVNQVRKSEFAKKGSRLIGPIDHLNSLPLCTFPSSRFQSETGINWFMKWNEELNVCESNVCQ